jgi:sugar transferase (PEP-CTERM/EpsH1 system associated)
MKQKFRIVHLVFSFSTGGMEKGIATLVQATHHEVEHIIVCTTQTGRSEELLPAGTRVISMEKPDGNSIGFLFRLSGLLKSLDPDVVHTRNWAGLDGVIAARLAGIRAVVHGEHGWGMADPDGLNRKRVWIRRVLSFLIREYTCVSQQMVSWLKEDIGVRQRVTQIYNGVDDEEYSPRKSKGDNNGVAICVVGRLDPIKDHLTLFKGFAALRKQIPETQLYVIGDGPERKRLEQASGEGTIFLGNRRDIPDLLRKMDLFVLPSINEGISNTILEAMATGLPVAATKVGGNIELVQDGINGRLFEVGDWEHLSEIMLDYCLNKEKRTAHGKASRRIIQSRFSIDQMVGAYMQVWKRVARKY